MKRLEDRELVARIRENDEQAKEIMYRQYREEYLGWALKSMFGITEDEALTVYADACVAVWDNVIRRKYELIPGASFKTYLFRVAMNIWMNKCRKERKSATGNNPEILSIDNFPDSDNLGNAAPDIFITSILGEKDDYELKKEIVRDVVFNVMTDPCQSIFRYVYYKKMNCSEIAERMSYKGPRTVITLANRCRRKLAAVLNDRFKKSGLI